MKRLLIALAALILLRADMYPDASNAKLPEARDNLGLGGYLDICAAPGVTCDGTTDDAAAVNAALAAKPAVYRITQGKTLAVGSTLSFTQPNAGLLTDGATTFRITVAPATVKWIGPAGGTVIKAAPIPGPAALSLTGMRFGGFAIDCQGGANSAATGFEMLNSYYARVEYIFAERCSGDAFLLGSQEPAQDTPGVGWSDFTGLRCREDLAAGNCFRLASTPLGNVHHSTFINLNGQTLNGTVLMLDGPDSNVFINATGGASGNGISTLIYPSATRNAADITFLAPSNASAAASFVVAGTGGIDGVSTNASTTWCSNTGGFTYRDAGRAVSGTNIPGATTIASVTTPKCVVLSAPASASGTALTYTVAGRYVPTGIAILSRMTTNGASEPVWGTGAGANVGMTQPDTLRMYSGGTIVGDGAGAPTGPHNVGVGTNVLAAATTGQQNTVVGRGSGEAITTGGNNAIFGPFIGGAITTAGHNLLLGTHGSCSPAGNTSGNIMLCAGAAGPVLSATGGTAPATSVAVFAGTVIGKPPVSCAGLAAGTLWNNAGAPAICP